MHNYYNYALAYVYITIMFVYNRVAMTMKTVPTGNLLIASMSSINSYRLRNTERLYLIK